MARRRIGILAAVALVAMAKGVKAADYYLVSANQNQIALIDRDAIAPAVNHIAKAPMVAIRRPGQTLNYSFAYAVVETDFDCANRRVASAAMTLFTKEGDRAAQQPAPSAGSDWQPAAPKTQAGEALDFVCATAPPATTFRFQGLSLAQIVKSVFDGQWPGPHSPSR